MTGRPRVLVADDHRAMRDTLVRMLSRDFDVVAAVGDGLTAVAEAEHLEPDLLVLDIAMPGLNGIAAAAQRCPRRTALVTGPRRRLISYTPRARTAAKKGSRYATARYAISAAAAVAGS